MLQLEPTMGHLNTQTAAYPHAKANMFAAMRRREGAWRK
jgi:hypothetical protein